VCILSQYTLLCYSNHSQSFYWPFSWGSVQQNLKCFFKTPILKEARGHICHLLTWNYGKIGAEKLKSKYADKIPTLALLTLGGLSEEDLLTYPDVTRENLSDARKLLTRRGWIVGTCEICGRIAWLHKMVWEKEGTTDTGKICGDCDNKFRELGFNMEPLEKWFECPKLRHTSLPEFF